MSTCVFEAFGGPGTVRVRVSGADHQLWELVSEALQTTDGIKLAALAPEGYDSVSAMCVWYDDTVLPTQTDVVRVIGGALRGLEARILALVDQARDLAASARAK